MLSEKSVKRALVHLTAMGDTDIFPAPFEFHFYRECSEKIVEVASKFDFGGYAPRGCVEVLSPKGGLAFRIAHQIYPADTVFYTSAVIEIANDIECLRREKDDGPFSYRYIDDEQNPRLFDESAGYHQWIEHLQEIYESIKGRGKSKYRVIETDISDFYQRIYFHRIEHVLDDAKANNAVRKIIEGIIKSSRARQSYGLPVGTSASRLLAEGLLDDTDDMVSDVSEKYSRYVDDFRIVVSDATNAHSTLCDLAQHLMLTEGLSLNSSKTRIRDLSEAIDDCKQKLSDVFHDDDIVEINRVIRRVYDDEDVSLEEDLQEVDPEKIVDKMAELLKRKSVDYGLLKILLRAIRATGHDEPHEIIEKFGSLLYFLPRDFCLMVGSLAERHPNLLDPIADILIEKCNEAPTDKMLLSKVWVSHLFIAQVLPITKDRLKDLSLGDSSLEVRALLLLKGLLKDRAFFRGKKTSFAETSDWAKSALLYGASCMSESEYGKWLDTVKSHYGDPFRDVYLKWLKSNRENLYDFLREDFKIKNRIERLAADFEDLDS